MLAAKSGCIGRPASPGSVKRRFAVSPSIISTAWRRYQETGHYTRRAGQGGRRALTQQQDRHLLLCTRRTARAPQNNLWQAIGVHVSEQTVRNRLHKGLTSSSGTCAHRPAPCSSIGRSTIRALFTSQMSRFTLNTCDRHERVQRYLGERYAVCNIIQYDRFGGGAVIAWGDMSLEGRTDLHVIANGPWLLSETGMKTSERLSDLGWPLTWPPCSPDLNPIKPTYGMLCIGASDTTKYSHRLSRSSLMPWSRSGRSSPRTPSADSPGACPDAVGSAYRHVGTLHTTEPHYECRDKIHATWIGLQFIFIALFSSVIFLFSHEWVGNFVFHCALLFTSQGIIQCTSVKIFKLNNSLMSMWCVLKVFP